ncbi:MAG TPA: hypothetical protein VM658_03550 [bacterium]|nr:hypothetical protein [bacterium]
MEKATHKLGELLMQAGLIDEIQLRSALGHQKRWGGKLGKALVDQGFMDEEVMLKFLAERFKMKAVNLIRSRISPQTFEMVPEHVAKKYEVVPVVVTGSGNKKTIVLAMSDPSDLRAIDEVQFLTGAKVEPVLATDSAISKVLQHYGDFTPEMAREFQYEKTSKPVDLKQAAQRTPARPPQRAPAPAPPPSDEGIDLQSAENIQVVQGEVTMIKAMKPQPKAPPPEPRKPAPPPRPGAPAPRPPEREARPAGRPAEDDSLFLIQPDRSAELLRSGEERGGADAGKDTVEASPLLLKGPAPTAQTATAHEREQAPLIAPPLDEPPPPRPAAPPAPEPPVIEAPPLHEEPQPPAFFVAPSIGGDTIGGVPAAPPAVPDFEPAAEAPAQPPAEEPDEIEPIELPDEEPGEMLLAEAHEFIQPQSYEAPPPDDGEKLELADAHEFLAPLQHEEPVAPPWESLEPPPLEGPPAIDSFAPPAWSDDFLAPAAPSGEAPPFEDIGPTSPVKDHPLLDLPPLLSEQPEGPAESADDIWGGPGPAAPDEEPKISIKTAAQQDDAWGRDLEPPSRPPSPPADDVWGSGAELPPDDIWGTAAQPEPSPSEPPIPELPPLPDLEPEREEALPPLVAPPPPGKSAAPSHEDEKPEDDFFEAAAPESDQELEYGIDRSDHLPMPPPAPAQGAVDHGIVFLPFEGPPPDLPEPAAPDSESIGGAGLEAPLSTPAPEDLADDESDDLMRIFQPGAMSEAAESEAPLPGMEISILENLDSPSIPDLGSLPELDLEPLGAPTPVPEPAAPPEPLSPRMEAEPPPPLPEPPTPPAPDDQDAPVAAGEMKQVAVAPDESPGALDKEEEIKRLMDLGDEFLDTREVKRRLGQLAGLENEIKQREYQFDELLNLMMRKELGEITQELFMKELQVLKKKADTGEKGPGRK